MELSDLNEPERLLWAAFPRGAWVDLRTGDVTLDDPGAAHSWGAERVIRAEVISALLLGATEAVPGRVPGVWLRGARITGRLYLSGITFRAALECQGCFFEDDLAFVESTAQTIRITGSRLPSFIGARMRLDGLLDLSECVIDSIRLDYARLDSEVRLRGTIAGNDTAGIALTAEGLSVNGRLDCEGLRARGTVELRGGHISGPLNLTGAQITSLDERGAVVLHNLVVDGRFNAGGMVVHGGLSMDNARIGGSMHLDGVQLRSPGVHGFALGGGGLTVEGSVWCRGGFCADGEVRFVGAKLGANLNLKGARLANPGGVALNLNRAAVGDVHCPNLVVSAGRLSLAGTQIGGGLSLQGASLEDGTLNDDTPILDIEGASMRSLELTRLTANGEVRVRTSRIEGRVFLAG
ncbi:MAG TPA: hypothetical protein VNW94_17910, partial [Streptosporangiaceae bacterium]|nr:hypothetical protein [Streptosporangiaceae bacterium]